MPEYRLYKIQKDGHIAEPPSNIIVPDDTAAIANKSIDRQDIEIWQGPRLVAYVVRAEPS